MNKYLKMVGNIVLYLGSLIVISVLVGLGTGALIRSEVISGNAYRWLYENQGTLNLVTAVITLCIYLVVFKLKKKSLIEFCEIKPINKKSIIMLLGIGLSMGVFTTALTATPFISENYPDIDKTINFFMGSGNIIAVLFSAVLIMPAFEEIVFRGLIFNELKNYIALPIAFLIQNILFALIQPSLPTMIFGFIGGIIFTLGYIWAESLWGAIIIQTSSCFFMMLFRRLGIHMVFRSFSDITILILIIAATIAIAYIMFSLRKNYKNNTQKLKNLSI